MTRGRVLLREAVGSALLFGCGGLATVVARSTGIWRVPIIAAGFGLGRVLAGLTDPQPVLRVNPASSLLSWRAGRIDVTMFMASVATQIVAMTVTCALVLAITGAGADDLVEVTSSPVRSCVVVSVTSLVWFHVLVGDPGIVRIGAVYTTIQAVGISVGGGSLNPARTLAPLVLGASSTGWWAFVIPPIVVGLALAPDRLRRIVAS